VLAYDENEAVRRATFLFVEWAAGNPDFYPVVFRALTVMQMALRSPLSLADKVAGRDAAAQLYVYATDGGFVDAASWFYRVYELLCLSLVYAAC
jgi:hypothetical protein